MRTGRNKYRINVKDAVESRSLGYAHWPEHIQIHHLDTEQSRSLGYAHWPEPLDWYVGQLEKV